MQNFWKRVNLTTYTELFDNFLPAICVAFDFPLSDWGSWSHFQIFLTFREIFILFPRDSKILAFCIRGSGAFWNMGGGGGGVGGSSLCQDYSSTRIFQNVYGCSRAQTNFFAMSPVFNVFVMDLQQCNRRQFFRWFFIVFMVLLRYVFSLRRAENVLWEVSHTTGYAK